jgi:hypothetical protein
MRLLIAAALALLIPPGVAAIQAADKIGKDRAPGVALKALGEVQKKKGAAVSQTCELGAGQQTTGTFQGVLRKDFVAVKGSAEIYARGKTTIVRTGDRYDQAANLRGEEALPVASFRNPAVLFADASRALATAAYLDDETLEGKDCKVVSLTGDARLVKEHLQEVGEVVQRQLTGFAAAMYSGNLTSYMDEKLSSSKFTLWVGKADLLIYKVAWVLESETKPAPLVPAFKITRKIEARFSQWDEDVAFDIPAPIKAKFGIK